jgi:hypothetical protein
MIQIKKATIKDLDQLAVLFNNYRVFYKYAPDMVNARKFLCERISNHDV